MSDPLVRSRLAADRARPRLEAGASVGEILRSFREDEGLGPLESMVALRQIEPVGLATAKTLVWAACAGHSYAHLTLADLVQLAHLPTGRLNTHLSDAVIDRRPWLLLAEGGPGVVITQSAPEPITASAGSISGQGVKFARLRDEIRALSADPAWADEIEIVRDEPSQLLIRFRRVRS